MKWLGWAAGFAVAESMALAFHLTSDAGLLLGFGLSVLGMLLGSLAQR
jgi:hypothetical protein